MRIRLIKLFSILLSLLFSSILQAQLNFRFKHLTVIDGLLHNSVTSFAQDSNGFIWIGTQRGLNRYDGYKLDSYVNESDLYTSVYNNRIHRIAIDGNYIWVATHKGLRCFDLVRKKYVAFKEDDKGELSEREIIQTLFVDSNRRLWVGSRDRLECVLITMEEDNIILKKINVINPTSGISHNKTFPEVVELDNGEVFALFRGEPYRLKVDTHNSKSVEMIDLSTGVVDIKKIASSGNVFWLFSLNKAVGFEWQDGSLVRRDIITYPACNFQGIVFRANNIFVSTHQGLMQIDRTLNQVDFYHHTLLEPMSVASDHQSGLFLDNQNNLWISTWGGGISYANISKQMFELVKFFPPQNNKYVPDEFVFSIHEDKEGDIYVGTKSAEIIKYNPIDKTFKYAISLKAKLNTNAVIPCIDSDDDWIYAAVTFDGTSIYRMHKLNKKIELVKSYGSQTIFSFGFDNHQQLWVGVLGVGLSCLKMNQGKVIDERLYSFQAKERLSLSSDMVNYVFIDKEKNEVLVSTDNGLNRLMLDEQGDVSAISYYLSEKSKSNTLSSNYVWPIDKENDSIYWVGTMGSGLNRVVIGERNEGVVTYKAQRFGTQDGAPSNDIESILVDKFGHVWCGGRYLSRFDYDNKKFKTYYEEDGVQSYLFATASSCRTRGGVLFFGGLKGMTYFTPDTAIVKREYKIQLTRLYINGSQVNVENIVNGMVVLDKDLQFVSDISIAYPCNNLKIEFSSLVYSQSKNFQYRYQLEGYDKEWVNTDGNSPQATYPRLPYGKFKFIVEAGEDDVWSDHTAEIEINILPPWWNSVLAYIIYIIVLSIIILIGARYSINWLKMKRQIAFQKEQERQTQELMELKTNFFTNISHEFKTPLTLINAAISETEVYNESLTANRYFQIIKRNNAKLLHLIGELMDFQRSSTSLIELNTTRIDVRQYVQELFDEFVVMAEKSDIEMKLILPPTEIMAWVDEECFTKIISNVFLNGLRYTEKGGSIVSTLTTGDLRTYTSIYPDRVFIDEDLHQGEHLILSIADTGVGISTISLPKVFDRYHTVISKTSKHLGSGIGLAFVKSLVKLHRGGIIISSERNVGTEFVFSIPLNSDYLTDSQKISMNQFDRQLYLNDYKLEELSVESSSERTLDDIRQTILLVDDNQDILIILSDHFQPYFNVLVAADGEEALHICNEKYPDIIISDVMMPKMNGLELCKRIKLQLSTCSIPVILLTARGTVNQQVEGIEEGADAYISKPFHFALLHATITNLLNKAKQFAQRAKDSEATSSISSTRNLALSQEKQAFINKITLIIEQNIDNSSYSVDNLSLEVGISRSRLYAQIKSITNQTLGDFIREIRLQKGAKLLRSTTLSISEVAFKIGIDSPSFFSRSFKERFGIPPSEYVKKMSNTEV